MKSRVLNISNRKKKIKIPIEIINTLNEKEKELYKNDPYIDISLVFELNDRGHLIHNDNAKLYLFYPLKISSGFSFIIHSYFLVNPERTELRDNKLNTYILEQIAEYITEEWLIKAKKNHPTLFLDFLCFERNRDHEILSILYDKLVEKLSVKQFIYDRISRKLYKLNQIILADGFNKGLFLDNILHDKRIVYLEEKATRDWLIREFKVSYLSYDEIAEHIEKECRIRQRKGKQSLPFFQNLYKYIVEHDGLNVRGKKILLSSDWQLRSSDDDVFYGMSKQDRIVLPESIQKHIYFIHPEIKISAQREGKGQTGYLEYNTELLLRRLLKLYNKRNVPKEDILNSLLQLDISDRLLPIIRKNVWLPVNITEWIKPIQKSVYIENYQLRELYNDESFVDYSRISQPNHIETEEINDKLISFGAWDIPGVYYAEKKIRIVIDDERFQTVREIRWNSTPYFVIDQTWNLDIPSQFTEWFSQTLIKNWNKYQELIENDEYSNVRFCSKDSDYHKVPKSLWFKLSNFIHTLKNTNWLRISEVENPLAPTQIIGIDQSEINNTRSQVLKKFLPLLCIHFNSNEKFFIDLGIIHLNASNIANYKQLFEYVYQTFHEKKELATDFKNFYNRLLSRLFEYFKYELTYPDSILELSECHFLSEDKFENSLLWLKANEIFYIDDISSYDLLPESIKRQVQPHFTNRDKNRFGQIAGKIGKKFSNSVNRTLINNGVQEEKEAKDYFPHLAEQIALIESFIEDSLDDIIADISKTKIYIQDNVEIEVTIDSKDYETKVIHANHFISLSDIPRIYVSKENHYKSELAFVAPLYDLVVELRGSILKMFKNTLNDFISSDRKQDFLKNYQVENDRIQEIKSLLFQRIYSVEQEFWYGILIAFNEPNPQSFLTDSLINFDELNSIIEARGKDLKLLHDCIDYDSLCNPQNIGFISEILTLFSISFNDFISSTNLKIDFYEYHSNIFNALKTKYKDFISWHIWMTLQNVSIDEQSNFQDFVDVYDFDLSFINKKRILSYNIEDHLWKQIEDRFEKFSFRKTEFKEDFNYEQELIKVFDTGKKSVELELKSKKIFNKDVFDDFIKKNKNRSLLYFNRTDKFIYLYQQFKKEAAKTPTEEDARFNLSKYKSEQNKSIKRINTSNTSENYEKNKGGFWGRGKRSSGNENQKTKDEVGLVAEYRVYHTLKELYGNVRWISKNAAIANVNPEGSDNNVHECDIIYTDNQNNLHFVEVKGQLGHDKTFNISMSELNKAQKEQKLYCIFYVSNALDNDNYEIYELGNIFMLDLGEALLNNSRYNARFKTLEIKFE